LVFNENGKLKFRINFYFKLFYFGIHLNRQNLIFRTIDPPPAGSGSGANAGADARANAPDRPARRRRRPPAATWMHAV